MKRLLIILISLLPLELSAQSLIINDAFMKMVGSSNIIQTDSAVGSIRATAGGIQTEQETGLVWRIAGSRLGQYTVPFVDEYGSAIPVKFYSETSTKSARLRFQTWPADSANILSLGSTVALKRLWRIEGLSRPAIVELRYAESDIPQSLLGESLLSISRFWKGQWILAQNTLVNPAQNSVSYVTSDSASYSTTWAVIEIDIPLATNIRWIDYECSSSELVWESDLLNYKYVIYGSNDGSTFTPIDSSHTQTRFNSARIGPKYKYLKIEQKFEDLKRYESKLIKTCQVRPIRGLGVYPNPTTGPLWIENADRPSVKVRDLNGKQMLTLAANRIDIGELVNGIYFVTVQDGEASKNFRIIKI